MSSGPCILESFLGSAIWGRRQREQANLSVKSPAMGRWSFPDILHHRAAATNDCLWHDSALSRWAEWVCSAWVLQTSTCSAKGQGVIDLDPKVSDGTLRR
jgi:hypothetical protein